MSEDATPPQAAEAANDTQPKVEKGEPIEVVVKDQHGHELHFKVRKTTRFDKASPISRAVSLSSYSCGIMVTLSSSVLE